MKTFTIIVVLGCSLLLKSCVNTDATRLSNQKYPKVNPEEVIIYLSEDDIPSDYQKIALIFAEGNINWTSQSKLLSAVREKAASLGANGVLYSRLEGRPISEASVACMVTDTDTERRAEVVAIYVR